MIDAPILPMISKRGNERAARQVTGGLEADDTLRALVDRPVSA